MKQIRLTALLEELTRLNAPSGYEEEVRDFIVHLLETCHIPYHVDRLGNVTIQRGENADRLALFAHMDEVGFGVRGIREDGMIKFAPLGGITEKILFSTPVTIGKDRVNGVIGNIPKHLQPKIKEQEITIADMMIDIGAVSYEDALASVRIGDPICWNSDFVSFGDGLIKAKALDDRVGVAVILTLLLSTDWSFTAVFTTREEIGTVGAKMIAPLITPKKAVVLEVTTCADMPGVKETTTRLGEGVALSVMDGGSVADRNWNDTIVDLAKKHRISLQKKLTTKGGNDAGAVSYVSGGVPITALSLPGRYIHSPVSVISRTDLEAMYRLTEILLSEGSEL